MTDRGFTYRLATALSPADRYVASLSVKPENANVAIDREETEAADGDDGDDAGAGEGAA